MPKGRYKLKRRKSANSAKKKAQTVEAPPLLRPSNALLPAQLTRTSSVPSFPGHVTPKIKKESTENKDDDGNNSDASTIPEAMDIQEGFCISEPEPTVNVVRVKSEQGESPTVIRVKEEKSRSPVGLAIKSYDSDSDDSVIIIPVEKTPPKVLEILEDDEQATVLPVMSQTMNKEEYINNWRAQSSSFNAESAPGLMKTEKDDGKRKIIADGNASTTHNLHIGGVEVEKVAIPIKQEPMDIADNSESVCATNSERNVQDVTIPAAAAIGGEFVKGASAVPIKQEPMNIVDTSGSVSNSERSVQYVTIPVAAEIGGEVEKEAIAVPIKQEQVVIVDYSGSESTSNSERSVPSATIPTAAACGEVEKQVLGQPVESKKNETTARIENKGKSKEQIEEVLKVLRARVKKEPGSNSVNVEPPESVSTTLTTSVQELDNAIQKPKDALASNDTRHVTEKYENEKHPLVSSTAAQNSELVSRERFSTRLLKYFNLNTVIRKEDAKKCLNYLSKYESKTNRFNMFFGDFERLTLNEKSIESEPSEATIERSAMRETVPLHTQAEKSSSSKIKIKLEKCQRKITNQVAQCFVTKESAGPPADSKLIRASQLKKRIAEEQHLKKVALPQENVYHADNNGSKLVYEGNSYLIPKGSVPQFLSKEKSPTSSDETRPAVVPSKEKLAEILHMVSSTNGETSCRINDQKNPRSSAISLSSRTRESSIVDNAQVICTIPSSANNVLSVLPNLTHSASDSSRKRTFSDADTDKAKKQKTDDPLPNPLARTSPSPLTFGSLNTKVPHSSACPLSLSSLNVAVSYPSIQSYRLNLPQPSASSTHVRTIPQDSPFGENQLVSSTQGLVFPSGIRRISNTIPPDSPLREIPYFSSTQDLGKGDSNHREPSHLPSGVDSRLSDPRLSKMEAAKRGTFPERIGTSMTQLRYEDVGKVSVSHEFLYLILQWNPAWLNVQKDTSKCPPICNEYPYVRHVYDNTKHYYNTYMPLHLLSVWLRIYQAWLEGRPQHKFRCDSAKEDKKTDSTTLTCSVVFPNEDGWPKREDIVLCWNSDEAFFARVKNVMKRNDTHAYKLKTELCCLVPPERLQPGQTLHFQILFNVRISGMQCHALENLHSNLRHLVLDPLSHKRLIHCVTCQPSDDVRLLRDRIRDVVLKSDARAVLVDTTHLSDLVSLLARVVYVLKDDYLVFLCMKSDRLFGDVSRRLRPYRPVVVVREKEMQLSQELAELMPRPKQRLADAVGGQHGIVITAFSSFLPEEFSAAPALAASKVVCIVDDADLCLEAETALPLRHKIDKLVLMGRPARTANVPLLLQRHRYDVSLFRRLLNA